MANAAGHPITSEVLIRSPRLARVGRWQCPANSGQQLLLPKHFGQPVFALQKTRRWEPTPRRL